jgi:hypothetical protein
MIMVIIEELARSIGNKLTYFVSDLSRLRLTVAGTVEELHPIPKYIRLYYGRVSKYFN